MELSSKHEQILQRRNTLLEQMEERRHQLRGHRGQHREQCVAAHTRNQELLQELEKMEQSLREGQLQPSGLQDLESRYWASVEESVPAWELFLLGKGPHPIDGPPAGGTKQRPRRAKDLGLPPRPLPVPVRR